MSVRTTADENLDRIRESLRQVNLDIVSWLVSDEVWGRGEYSEEKVQDAINLIRKARKLLS